MTEQPSPTQERSYIAFISYRHKPLDKQAAEKIQRAIERYTIPKELRRTPEEKRLGKVFRDEDELPASASLSNSITYALDHSQYLLVICTPDLPQSRWCEQEIRYFLATHDRDHVLAVLVDGEPEISFSPYLLHTFDEMGNITGDTEPLAANIAGKGHTIDRKAFGKEIVRVYAALLGCPFDTLWQRERRARANRLTALLGVGMAVMAGFFGVVMNKNAQITRKNEQITEQNAQITEQFNQISQQNEQISEQNAQINIQNEQISERNRELKAQLSSILVDKGYTLLEGFDRKGALQNGLDALLEPGDEDLFDRRVEKLLDNALGAYLNGSEKSSLLYEQSTNISHMAVDESGEKLLILDNIGNLSCVSTDTGALLWEARSFGAAVSSVDPPSRVYVSESQRAVLCQAISGVYAFSLEDGTPLWSYSRNELLYNAFFTLSPDGNTFVILDNLTQEYGTSQLVFCDAATGQVLGSTDLEEDGYRVKPPSYDGAYCYGAAFSDDGKLFGFCALAKAPEDEQADRFQFYLIDAASFEKKHGAKWDLDNSPTYMVYGMHVANDTGDIFCAQYHYRFGGLVTFRLSWAEDSFQQVFTNYTYRTDSGMVFLLSNEDERVPLLANDELALVFVQDNLFLFNTKDGELRKSFGLNGTILHAYWLDRDNDEVAMLLDNGSSVYYHLGRGSTAIGESSTLPWDQTGLSMALPVRRGLVANRETGMYLTVRKEKPTQVLSIRAMTDPSGKALPGQLTRGYTKEVHVTPQGDALMIFCKKSGEATVLVYDAETDQVVSRHVFTDLSYYDVTVLNKDSFFSGNKIYYMDGTEAYIDRITEANQSSFFGSSFIRAQVYTGQVVTVYPSGANLTLFPIWLDNSLVAESNDICKGLAFAERDLLTVGQNGYVLGYGKYAYMTEDDTLFKAEEPAFVGFDALTGERVILEDLFPEADERTVAMGTREPLFLCLDDGGRLALYDLRAGTSRLLAQYAPQEVKAFCFATGDRFLTALTAAGRIDCYETDTGTLVYSQQLIQDMTYMSRIAAYDDPERHRLQFIVSGTYDYGIFYSLDTEAWTVAANASDVYLWLPANNSLYTHRGDSIYRYPLHSLADLTAWARTKLP